MQGKDVSMIPKELRTQHEESQTRQTLDKVLKISHEGREKMLIITHKNEVYTEKHIGNQRQVLLYSY